MKITYAISNWIYGTEPLEKAFQRLKKFNYDAIELMVEDPAKLDMAQVKGFMKKYGMPVSSICTMMTGAADKDHRRNLIDADPAVVKNTLDYLKACMAIGEDLGAKLVLTVPSGVANVTDGWTDANQAKMVQALKDLGDHGKKTGKILLAIEPINRYENAFMQRGEQALALLQKVNHAHVKMMLDFFHCNIEESNMGDAIRVAGKNLIHCHVADSNRKSTGRGMTDWFGIMRALRDIDFTGALACEPLPPTAADVYASKTSERPEADQYAEECIKYLRLVQSLI
ncbi:MAG: sugar phosphate isomerase/epimerase [Candidatus Lokiarchaeota archaeon]|nr:sugar phosphate isomerase/epimerase [Candidatus Lokiarchaeota archaeon]